MFARLRPLDDEPAHKYLPPRLYRLFDSMPRREKQHALSVLKRVQNEGGSHPDLMVAALLHDVGKSRMPFSLPGRVAVVVIGALSPTLAGRWATGEPKGLRKPFVIHAMHPRWGAEMAKEAGASPLAVELIRRHHDPVPDPPISETDRLLKLLQAADNSA